MTTDGTTQPESSPERPESDLEETIRGELETNLALVGLTEEKLGAEAYRATVEDELRRKISRTRGTDARPRLLGPELLEAYEAERARRLEVGLPLFTDTPPLPIEACATCGGVTLVRTRPLVRGEARTAPGAYGPNLEPCPDCWRPVQKAKRLASSGIPTERHGWTLAAFQPEDGKQEALAVVTQALIGGTTGLSLLIVGEQGRGKSHLAIGAALEAIERELATIRYAYVPELLDDLRASYSGGSAALRELFRPLVEADVVILDDLGAEKPSEWSVEKLTSLVEQRTGRSTVITTNLEGPRAVAQVLGARLESRLREYVRVSVKGRDMRGAARRELAARG